MAAAVRSRPGRRPNITDRSRSCGCRPCRKAPPPRTGRGTRAADVRQHCPGVDINGVAADGDDHGDAQLLQSLAQVGRRAGAVAQVLVETAPSGPGLMASRSRPARPRRWEALGEDEHAPARLGRSSSLQANQPPMLARGPFWRSWSSRRPEPPCPARCRPLAVTLPSSRSRMNPGVLGEAGRSPRTAPDRTGCTPPYGPQVARLTAGRRRSCWSPSHDDGTFSARPGARTPPGITSRLPLNGLPAARVSSLGDHEVDGLGPGGLDVALGGFEVGVVGTNLPGPPTTLKRILLRGRPCGGMMWRKGKSSVTASRTGTTKVTRRTTRRRADGGPLVPAHRPRPESVSRSMSTSRAQGKQVVARLGDGLGRFSGVHMRRVRRRGCGTARSRYGTDGARAW